MACPRIRPPAARCVWYVTEEDPEWSARERLDAFLRGRALTEAPALFHLSVQRGVDLDDPAWQQRLLAEGRRVRPSLTILEPLRSLTAGADAGARELRPFVKFARAYMKQTGSSLAVGHHDTKPQNGVEEKRERAQRASGGGVFSVSDAPLHFDRLDDERVLIVPTSWKHGETPPAITVRLEADDPRRPTVLRLVGEAVAAGATEDVTVTAAVLVALRKGPTSGSALAATLQLTERRGAHRAARPARPWTGGHARHGPQPNMVSPEAA